MAARAVEVSSLMPLKVTVYQPGRILRTPEARRMVLLEVEELFGFWLA